MQLHEGMAEDYEDRHSPIWQELAGVIKQHGVSNYSIFFNENTHQLFAYLEIENEAQFEKIGTTQVCRNWWQYMQDIMDTHPDCSPVSIPLREVFHLN